MEREREKDLLEELQVLQQPLREQKARRDNLLRLIQSLQRIQASGPVASPARLPSLERANVAQAVEEYLTSTGSGFIRVQEPHSTSPMFREPLSHPLGLKHKYRSASGQTSFCDCADPLSHSAPGCRVIILDPSK